MDAEEIKQNHTTRRRTLVRTHQKLVDTKDIMMDFEGFCSWMYFKYVTSRRTKLTPIPFPDWMDNISLVVIRELERF